MLIVARLLCTLAAADPAVPMVAPAQPQQVPAEPPAPPLAAPAASSSAPTAPSDELAFGDHLFADGDYYRAVTEYRRYLFRTQGAGADAARVSLAIGEAYMRGAQYDAAAQQFEGVADRRTDAAGQAVAGMAAARAYLMDERPLLARPRVRRLFTDDTAAPVVRTEAGLLLAISYLQGENFEKARNYLQDPRVSSGEAGHAPLARALLKALGQRERLPQKSPVLAFFLSLVPGLGHFYLGQWAVGFTAFLWNALFTVGALDAWLQRSWGVAIILTILELTFYAGNVFGAVSGAFKYNRDQELNWKDAVRAQYEGVLRLPDPQQGTVPGSLIRMGVPLDPPVP